VGAFRLIRCGTRRVGPRRGEAVPSLARNLDYMSLWIISAGIIAPAFSMNHLAATGVALSELCFLSYVRKEP